MLKRFLTALVALLLALCWTLPALGEPGDGWLGDMTVVNCDEWVSLRAEPSTSAARLAKVPLGAMVYDCHQYDQRFVYCEYGDLAGYILVEYLAPVQTDAGVLPDGGRLVLDELVDGIHVTAERRGGEGETLSVMAVNDAGYPIWSYELSNEYVTELDGTAAFLGGTAEDPRVMVYGHEGLSSLRLATGEKVWQVEENLGGSLTAATGPDGTMYVGGYYGPNLVAISMDGKLLWQAEQNLEVYWLYEMELTDEGIVATYDHLPGDHDGRVCYSYDGQVLWMD